MKVYIKKQSIENFMKYHTLTKNRFSMNCGIAVKTFDKFMSGNSIELYIALKVADYTKIEYEKLFYFDE